MEEIYTARRRRVGMRIAEMLSSFSPCGRFCLCLEWVGKAGLPYGVRFGGLAKRAISRCFLSSCSREPGARYHDVLEEAGLGGRGFWVGGINVTRIARLLEKLEGERKEKEGEG